MDIFSNGLKKLNIELSEKQLDQFVRYYEMLIEKNKVMNLTAITEPNDVIRKHFLDSLALVKLANLDKKVSIIDVGTGAGFPGIPLKIAFPDIEIVLLDSLNKRIKFLDEVIDELRIENIKAIHGRSEELGQKLEYREKFDICVSRAVSNLSTLSEFCLPFIKVNGHFISYKAGNVQEEVDEASTAVDKLGGKVHQIVEFFLDETDICRTFVDILKIGRTPKRYPRKAGTPLKEPLK